jgi:phage/plasmid-like protein (TIGR03299 family)
MSVETTGYAITDAERPLWLGQAGAGWDELVHSVNPDEVQDAASMIAAAGLDWTVQQYPLETIVRDGSEVVRVPVPRHVANVRSDSGAVLGVVGAGYEPLQNRSAFAFCDAITDSGRAHWIGAGLTRGGARVHALMRLDREVRIGGAEGEEVLPLLCFRNGHDGGLAVTVSVAPFRLACLNGMLLPLEGAERTWKARHTANVEATLADARRTLRIAWRYYDQLEQLGAQLLRQRLDGREFERFLARLVPLPERAPDASEGGVPSATSSAYARRSAPPTGRRPISTRSAAPAGARCRPSPRTSITSSRPDAPPAEPRPRPASNEPPNPSSSRTEHSSSWWRRAARDDPSGPSTTLDNRRDTDASSDP